MHGGFASMSNVTDIPFVARAFDAQPRRDAAHHGNSWRPSIRPRVVWRYGMDLPFDEIAQTRKG